MDGIATNLQNVTNATEIVGKAMKKLIEQWLNLPTYYGWRPLGDDPTLMKGNIAIFVQPSKQIPDLVTLGKYKRSWNFFIYVYIIDNSAEDIVSLNSYVEENLIKLFSLNALNDKETASPPSNNFRSYPPFWDDSDIGEYIPIPTFTNVLEGRDEKYMQKGRLSINVRQELVLI